MHLIGISVWGRCSQLSVRRVAFSVCVRMCVCHFPGINSRWRYMNAGPVIKQLFIIWPSGGQCTPGAAIRNQKVFFFKFCYLFILFFYFFINKIKDLLFMTQLTLCLWIHPLHGLTPDGDTLLPLHLWEGGSPCWLKKASQLQCLEGLQQRPTNSDEHSENTLPDR